MTVQSLVNLFAPRKWVAFRLAISYQICPSLSPFFIVMKGFFWYFLAWVEVGMRESGRGKAWNPRSRFSLSPSPIVFPYEYTGYQEI